MQSTQENRLCPGVTAEDQDARCISSQAFHAVIVQPVSCVVRVLASCPLSLHMFEQQGKFFEGHLQLA